jgi:signal transduction histidine kinase
VGLEDRRPEESLLGRLFMLAVLIPTLIGLGAAAVSSPHGLLQPEVLAWILIVAVVELLPVAVTRQLQLTLGFPILLGVAILYSPHVAGLVALFGSFDARELQREISLLKAGFNRAQIALATVVGSAVFHWIAPSKPALLILVGGSLAATVANYGVNTTSVVIAMRLLYGSSFRRILAQMRLGALSQFLLNYVGLSLIGVVIARLYDKVGFWSVVAFVLPLVFARQMFFRTMALEEAGKELKDREQVLRALSNRMAEERQDERMQIAAYLHDDLAQMLFRLNLQVEMAKRRLASGDLDSVLNHLEGITSTKEQTSKAIRALIRDLHRSPIGRKGLAEAIQSFADDLGRGSTTRIAVDVIEVSLPPPIQLLIYQIAREAATNALKHAEAANIWISLQESGEGVGLQIRDDGRGFDTEAPAPAGHFGSVMMRERALVAGGSFSVESRPGQGTSIRAIFPRLWVEEGSLLESAPRASEPGDDTKHYESTDPAEARKAGAAVVGRAGSAVATGTGRAGSAVAEELGGRSTSSTRPGENQALDPPVEAQPGSDPEDQRPSGVPA